MATKRWRGGAPKVAQVTDYLFGGTWEATDVVVATIGSKAYSFVVVSTVIATLLDTIVAAWNLLSSSEYPEFGEMTASRTSTTLRLTGAAGVPFACTLATTETGGGGADAQTIDGVASSTGTNSTACSSQNHWSIAANWDTGTVPVSTDDVIIEATDVPIKYGLAQSAVTLGSLTWNRSFTGFAGLPEINTDGVAYPEYRDKSMDLSATTETIGRGTGQGAGRIRRNAGSAQTTLSVHGTGSALDNDVEVVQWKGTHAANVVNLYRGSMAIAGYGGEVATVATLRIGYEQSSASDATLRCGAGATLATVNMSGGAVELNSAATTVAKTGGDLTVNGAGALTTLTQDGGATFWRSSGTLGTCNVGSGSSFSMAGDNRAKTVTIVNLYDRSTFLAPEGQLAAGTVFNFVRCGLPDVVIDLGPQRSLTLST